MHTLNRFGHGVQLRERFQAGQDVAGDGPSPPRVRRQGVNQGVAAEGREGLGKGRLVGRTVRVIEPPQCAGRFASLDHQEVLVRDHRQQHGGNFAAAARALDRAQHVGRLSSPPADFVGHGLVRPRACRGDHQRDDRIGHGRIVQHAFVGQMDQIGDRRRFEHRVQLGVANQVQQHTHRLGRLDLTQRQHGILPRGRMPAGVQRDLGHVLQRDID